MFLLKWYREYLDIKNERETKKRELQYCEACETLKLQLSVANEERRFLLEKLTDKPDEVKESNHEPQNLKPILPNRVPWAVRRQMLESEDRAAAKALRKNEDELKAKSNDGKVLTINEIERELGVENG